MIADMNAPGSGLAPRLGAGLFTFEPPDLRRTQAEKAVILARLTLQLAALDYERRQDGHA